MNKTLFDIQIDSGALFSDCRKYRYALWRIWDKSKPLVMFIGLNPSTANEATNDPTIESVERISRYNGYGGFYMMNLFGIISSDPKILKSVEDPIGDNMKHHDAVYSKCKSVVFAWGAFKEAEDISRQFEEKYPNALCIGQNKNRSPKHPLFQPEKSAFVAYQYRPKRDDTFLHNQLVKLGDMMGDGLHHEEPWIAKEYKKVAKALYPDMYKRDPVIKENRSQKVLEWLKDNKCECGGQLIQKRIGSMKCYCGICGNSYTLKFKKAKKN